eukprot:247390-Chlamydomonas_euryale.AAC.10
MAAPKAEASTTPRVASPAPQMAPVSAGDMQQPRRILPMLHLARLRLNERAHRHATPKRQAHACMQWALFALSQHCCCPPKSATPTGGDAEVARTAPGSSSEDADDALNRLAAQRAWPAGMDELRAGAAHAAVHRRAVQKAGLARRAQADDTVRVVVALPPRGLLLARRHACRRRRRARKLDNLRDKSCRRRSRWSREPRRVGRGACTKLGAAGRDGSETRSKCG